MTRSPLLGTAIAALFPLAVGCAAQSGTSGKQQNELSEQVRRLQATTDRLQERLSALENMRAREAERAPPEASVPTYIPELPVVKMNLDASSSNADAPSVTGDGDEPRPLIVGEGSRIETRTSSTDSTAVSSPPRRSKDKPSADATTKRSKGSTESGKKSP